MRYNLKKIAYVFIILLILTIGFVMKIYAVTEEELKTKQSEIDEQIDSTNTEIAGIKDSMTSALEQINRLNIQISEYESELAEAKEKQEELESKLKEKQEELEEAKSEYDAQKALVNARLIAIYENSKTTYLDLLIGSKDISDFLSKYYMLERLAQCDNNLLKSLEDYKTEVQTKTKEAEKEYSEVKNSKDTIEAKSNAMEVLIADKNNLVSNLSEEEIKLNQQLEEFEEDKKQIEEELKELARQNAIAASIKPSASGYISPLLGKTKANITTTYHGYSGHTGVDFAISSGTEILAVKKGTVVTSKALVNSNGTYRSYGEYVVIDHHDGTMTLYAHGTPNSRTVEVRRRG
jgi:peptidoglycan hydrolase CwlO-like protein